MKAFRQTNGLYASGSVAVEEPDNALTPTAIVGGSSLLPSCGDVALNGRKSVGGGGRDMMFEWAVSSSGGVSDVNSELSSKWLFILF